jgi:dienelactone hydrolase
VKLVMNLVNYKLHFNIFQVFIFFLLAACRSTEPVGGQNQLDHPVVPGALSTSPPSPSATVTILPSITPTTLPSPTPTVEATPSASPTPDPWTGLSIDSLTARTYGGGNIEIVETLAANSYFTRTLITYPSDGLDIYGFMNTPVVGEPPYPVVIALHGYINPEIYHTIDYTTRYADALAREGYLVIHPNLRGYPPSDEGDNLFRVGMAIDTLNLISLIKQQAGKPGPLSMADPDKIGIWGHSMGGGVSTRVITISSDVRAAVLYGAMSGDEQQNFERIYDYFSNGERGMEELSFPEEAFERISPINYLERVRAAVSIHHGENDVEECYTYEDQPHTFHGEGDNLFIMQMVNFYNRILRGD